LNVDVNRLTRSLASWASSLFSAPSVSIFARQNPTPAAGVNRRSDGDNPEAAA
jgi:hypothetical protein